jgi:hypothetical protein
MNNAMVWDELLDIIKDCRMEARSGDGIEDEGHQFVADVAGRLARLRDMLMSGANDFVQADFDEPCETLHDRLMRTGDITGATFRFRGHPTGVVRTVGVEAHRHVGRPDCIEIERGGRLYAFDLRRFRVLPRPGGLEQWLLTYTGHWDTHPEYPRADWQHEVANGETMQGYRDWLRSKAQEKENGEAE